jgi:hypothetical protein
MSVDAGGIRSRLLESVGRLKRRGLDQSLDSQDVYFPEENELPAEGDRSLRYSYQSNFPVKTRVWLKMSDFSWVGGIIDNIDERLICDTQIFSFTSLLSL